MGQQVNVVYSEDLVAALDRLAAARRVARPELLRMIAQEAVEAHDSGRLAFQRQEGPTLDVSISGLVVQLREALMECSRMQGENLRTAKRLQEAFTGSEATVRAALDKVWAHIRKLGLVDKGYPEFD
jgi:tRNA A37 threonylcarbamoyltransferase TsaD